MTYTVLQKTDLARAAGTGTATFEGRLYGAHVSFYWVDLPPGSGVRLHRHPCEEIFIIQEGRATFRIDAEIVEAEVGQIIIVPPDVPHAFRNSGDGPLRQIDVLPCDGIVVDWLEDEEERLK